MTQDELISELIAMKMRNQKAGRRVGLQSLLVALLVLLVVVHAEDLPDQVNNGVPIEVDEYPWFTALLRTGRFLCGGSWVGSKYVLSAAHCTIDVEESLFVEIGYFCSSTNDAKNVDVNERCDKGERLRLRDVVAVDRVHYLFSGGDLALLQLQRLPQLAAPYARVDLQGKKLRKLKNKKSRMTLVGAGKTESGEIAEIVEKLNVTYLSAKTCAKRGITRDLTGHICSLPVSKEERTGPCRGDSGGPLVVKKDIVIAVHAFGRNFCDAVRQKPDGHYAINKEARDLLRDVVCTDEDERPRWCPKKPEKERNEEGATFGPTSSPSSSPLPAVTGEIIRTLSQTESSNAPIRSLSFDPTNDARLVSAGETTTLSPPEGKLQLWQVPSGLSSTDGDVSIYDFAGSASGVTFSSNGAYVLSASVVAFAIQVWDTVTPEDGQAPYRAIENDRTTTVQACDWNHDSTRVVCGMFLLTDLLSPSQIWVWDVENDSIIQTLRLFGFSFMDFCWWHKSGGVSENVIGTIFSGRTMILWNADTGTQVKRILLDSTASMRSVQSHRSLPLVVSGMSDGSVVVWKVESGQIQVLLDSSLQGVSVDAVAFSPNGNHVVSGSADGRIHIWNVEKGQLVGSLDNNGVGVSAVDWSHASQSSGVIAATFGTSIRIWKLSGL